jgi:hypothetical protein
MGMCVQRPPSRWAEGIVAGVLALAWPAVAHAQHGEEGATDATSVVLLLGLVGAAYLLAHFVVDRLQRRLLVVAGLEYIILGILLGPAVPELHVLDNLSDLLPVLALAAGWVGLVRGMELRFRALRNTSIGTLRLALGDDIVAGVSVAIPAYFFLVSGTLGEIGSADAWLAAGVLGCCSATGSTDPIDVIEKRYEVDGDLVHVLRRSARLGDAAALAAFGVLVCVFHHGDEHAPIDLSWFEWTGVTVGIGVILGILFRFFLGAASSENGRFLTLVGVITFASGAAWFLDLSALFINLVLGAMLVNFAPSSAQIQTTLNRTQRPMSLVLLLFAGALWQPPEPVRVTWNHAFEGFAEAQVTLIAIAWWILLPLIGFVVVRYIGKRLGSAVGAWGNPLRPDLYRGLLGHGDAAVAMAISMRLIYTEGGLAIDVAFTTILISVVIHDLIAPRILRALLVDAGELRRELNT